MTKLEFTGQFDRLCHGLKYDATSEQAEAIYRRIGQVSLSVWAESVTTLLCDGRSGYLPKLEHVLTVLEQEGERQRKAQNERDRFTAQKVYKQLNQPVNTTAISHSPTPETPLFACIKAFAGRADCLRRLQELSHVEKWSEQDRARERERLSAFLAQHEQDIARYSPLLDDVDAARLVQKYETGVAV